MRVGARAQAEKKAQVRDVSEAGDPGTGGE